jgi:hypothetical protein
MRPTPGALMGGACGQMVHDSGDGDLRSGQRYLRHELDEPVSRSEPTGRSLERDQKISRARKGRRT